MTAADWGQLAGLIITAIGTALAHWRISRSAPPPK